MGARIRPINNSDKSNFAGEVFKASSGPRGIDTGNTTESSNIFSDSMEVRFRAVEHIEEQACFNRRGYITLTMSVMNYFVAGKYLELLAVILGIQKEDLLAIAEGDIIYDKEQGLEVRAKGNVEVLNWRYDRDRFLIGAQYVRRLIDELDVYEVLQAILKYNIEDVLNIAGLANRITLKMFNSFRDAEKDESDYLWLIDKYYLSKEYIREAYRNIKPDCEFEDFLEAFEEKWQKRRVALLDGDKPRFTLLKGLWNNGKDVIANQVLDFIPVLPIGYRPRMKSRKMNSTTDAYNQVVRRNQNLAELLMLTQSNLESVIASYKSLIASVKNLTIENGSLSDPTYKSIGETLVGKEGVIRSKMEGVLVDYSARSVIIVDPDMSIDTVGIPITIATKLLELLIVKKAFGQFSNNLDILTRKNVGLKKKMAKSLLEGKYTITGRQPTLFYLGIKAFKTKIVDGNAIVLNPLCTPSFNADFDGDQMHVEIPISKEATEEVEAIMASTSNLFLSRNGECHIAPRQEILHGLWKASSIEMDESASVLSIANTEEGLKELYDNVCTQTVRISDPVSVNGVVKTAGCAALQYALGWDSYGLCRVGSWPLVKDSRKGKPVTEKWFKRLLGHVALESIEDFVTIVNRLTKLGFCVANIFPPNMSVLQYPDVSWMVDEFDKAVAQREEYYNMGLETDQAFTAFYDKAYTDLEKRVKAVLSEKLDSSCGYFDMVNSGARGSMSNIMQLFGMKGRVMKNDNEAFNSILRSPLASQLTGLEHAITAYGSRQGLIDKTLSTDAPGYLERQLRHTAAYLHITMEDCHTNDGLLIDYELMRHFIPEQELTGVAEGDNNRFRAYVTPLLVGRYIVGRSKMITNLEQAEAVYDEQFARVENSVLHKLPGIKLRSPITCKNPCCEKCYGIDLATNRKAVPGTPVGLIAAQSISEPSTQLIMKNFQNGGIAGISNLTSSFDVLSGYMHLKDMREASKPINYDFISPGDGYVRTVSRGDGIAQLQILNDKGKSILRGKTVLVYEGIQFKDYVHAGESVQKIQGDLNMAEIMEHRGIDFAQKYLAFKLYDIFHKNVEVNLKHFEAVVLCMTFYTCLRGDADNHFKLGCKYTAAEYSKRTEDCIFEKTLVSVREAALKKTDVFSTMFMERVSQGLSKSIITSGYDEMKDPIVRTAFGLSLGMGTDYPGYKETRGRIPVEGYDVQ